MNILFLSHYKWPHVGGVERHCERVASSLQRLGHKVKLISEEDIRYPHVKLFGLIYIWFWLFGNRGLIENADIIHCHDVFIWYLPFKFLYPKKPVFTTFHGWEGYYPIPLFNIFQKRLANRLSNGTITVGKYIEKYYGVKTDKTIYGGTTIIRMMVVKKERNSVVFVGRLEKDTGTLDFLKWLKIKGKGLRIDFVGDGNLREMCEKYGVVHGFTDPSPFMRTAEICVPGGYLSYIEAKDFGCKIKVFPNNLLKKDYWEEIEKVDKFPTWDEITNEYLSLYNSIK